MSLVRILRRGQRVKRIARVDDLRKRRKLTLRLENISSVLRDKSSISQFRIVLSQP